MVGFVVLHYKNIDDTIECIKSVLSLKGEKEIVVVDNNTLTNNDESRLKKFGINLIKLDENMGFAKANNIGKV